MDMDCDCSCKSKSPHVSSNMRTGGGTYGTCPMSTVLQGIDMQTATPDACRAICAQNIGTLCPSGSILSDACDAPCAGAQGGRSSGGGGLPAAEAAWQKCVKKHKFSAAHCSGLTIENEGNQNDYQVLSGCITSECSSDQSCLNNLRQVMDEHCPPAADPAPGGGGSSGGGGDSAADRCASFDMKEAPDGFYCLSGECATASKPAEQEYPPTQQGCMDCLNACNGGGGGQNGGGGGQNGGGGGQGWGNQNRGGGSTPAVPTPAPASTTSSGFSWDSTKGHVVIIAIVAIIMALVLGGVWYYMKKKNGSPPGLWSRSSSRSQRRRR